MDTILRIIQVILALSILVIFHEFGHYTFARLFKIRVEQFYLFFPPAIFKWKPKKSDTEFGIGSIPLGGFCKISGMIDESLDTNQMKHDPQPWEFRSKPAWKRLFVMSGGVLFNFILAFILFSAIMNTWGTQYLKNSDAKYGIEVNDLAKEIGFRSGDKILSFDGEAIDDFNDLQVTLARNQAKTATVIRQGDTINIDIDPVYIPAILNTPGMFAPATPIAIASVPDTSINASANLLANDRFISVDTVKVVTLYELKSALNLYKGKRVDFRFLRGDQIKTIPLQVSENATIGVLLASDISDMNITRIDYNFFSSIPAGWDKFSSTLSNYIKELGLIFQPKTQAYKSVGSFIAIGKIFPTSWDWRIFWNICAWLSVMLGVMNLLPIPGLDGGHILFTLYEIITRKKPSDRFLINAQIVGMAILFLLIFVAFGNDIMRLIN